MLFVWHHKILHKHCLQFLLGVKMAPRETVSNGVCKIFGVTNKEYYGMLWHFLEWSIVFHYQHCDNANANFTAWNLRRVHRYCSLRWSERIYLRVGYVFESGFWQKHVNQFLWFLASLIKNGWTLTKCYLFCYRLKKFETSAYG